MYVRRYAAHEGAQDETPLSIPENYGGNAFHHTEEPIPCPTSEDTEAEEKAGRPTKERSCAQTRAELLPVLLSVLLSESKEHEDLATLLLFLLLL